MEPDKKHIHHCLLFCFHQKKRAVDAHRIICRRMMKMLLPLERVRIGLNDLEVKVISVTKNAPDVLQLWKRTNCEKKKLWKMMENISINLYRNNFFINKKKLQKSTRTFADSIYSMFSLSNNKF